MLSYIRNTGILKPNQGESMKILDIMTDLETLGKGNSPVITQISAVAFNLETGEIFPDEFDKFVSPMSSVKAGLDIDSDTVSWWLKQDKEAIEKVFVESILNGEELKSVLLSFNSWIESLKLKHNVKSIRIYGNGVLADIKWLESAYDSLGIKPSWDFRDPSDVRTLVDLGKRLFNVNPKDTIAFEGIKHNAIDDCKHQIKYCCAIVKSMK